MRDFQKPERSEIFSSNGMIATSHPLAAKIGLDIMSKGGNAIDAAITAASAVPEPSFASSTIVEPPPTIVLVIAPN